MIISASRRTDIPAFYWDWFCGRLQEGYVDVVNPFNRRQVSRISLFIGIGFAAHADSSSLLTGKLLGDERIIEHGKQTGNLLQE